MTIALIDADIIAHRAAAAAVTSEIDWGDTAEMGDVGTYDDIDGAIRSAKSLCETWRETAKCDRIILCFSAKGNFRKRLLPTYKANRVKPKPGAFVHVVDALKQHYDHRAVPGLEADDVLGILHTRPRYHDSVIVTMDKDLRTIPGRHVNPMKPDEGEVAVTVDQADRAWMMQTLTGDSSDGYSGCPKVGPVGAAAILLGKRNVQQMWVAVSAAFAARGVHRQALVMARVARILRTEDYDIATKSVRLWSPNGDAELMPLETLCVELVGP